VLLPRRQDAGESLKNGSAMPNAFKAPAGHLAVNYSAACRSVPPYRSQSGGGGPSSPPDAKLVEAFIRHFDPDFNVAGVVTRRHVQDNPWFMRQDRLVRDDPVVLHTAAALMTGGGRSTKPKRWSNLQRDCKVGGRESRSSAPSLGTNESLGTIDMCEWSLSGCRRWPAALPNRVRRASRRRREETKLRTPYPATKPAISAASATEAIMSMPLLVAHLSRSRHSGTFTSPPNDIFACPATMAPVNPPPAGELGNRCNACARATPTPSNDEARRCHD
jgi:hypothetical protein